MVATASGSERVVLYVRAGCHLCATGREVVARVAEETGAAWREVDVDVSPGTRSLFGELVPAVLVDGVLVDHWRIDEARLRRAIEAQAPGGAPGGAPGSAQGGTAPRSPQGGTASGGTASGGTASGGTASGDTA
jgi:hypothetical protein